MDAPAARQTRSILIEGFQPDDILALPDDHIAALMTIGPLVFTVGSAKILGQIRSTMDCLTVELAQIDGGGEGVIPTLWRLSEQYARQRDLKSVEWIVHAISCAKPNPKLRRVLEKRGFEIRDLPGIGQAYYFRRELDAKGHSDS